VESESYGVPLLPTLLPSRVTPLCWLHSGPPTRAFNCGSTPICRYPATNVFTSSVCPTLAMFLIKSRIRVDFVYIPIFVIKLRIHADLISAPTPCCPTKPRYVEKDGLADEFAHSSTQFWVILAVAFTSKSHTCSAGSTLVQSWPRLLATCPAQHRAVHVFTSRAVVGPDILYLR
jgi:hypothetical protein